MNCVILQPSYIPWRGYFDQIRRADCFIFLDDVQYDRRGWRNRNRIKTPQGPQWLTIPVLSKGCRNQHTRICDIPICHDTPWREKHWGTLEQNYRRAPFFDRYAPLLQSFYNTRFERLSDLTISLTVAIARELGYHQTRFLNSSDLGASGTKTDHLLDLLQSVGATHYITGPSARDYLEEDKFMRAGITLEYMDYKYPEYPQLYPPYDPQVSIIDLLFMTGPDAARFIGKSGGEPAPEARATFAGDDSQVGTRTGEVAYESS